MTSFFKTNIHCVLAGATFVFLFYANQLGAQQTGEIPAGDGTRVITLIEAVRQTLEKQPSIMIQESQVEISKGALQGAGGQFDWNLGTSFSRSDQKSPLSVQNQAATGKSKAVSEITSYRLSVDKQLRTGIVISPNLEMTRTKDRSFGAPTTEQSSINLTVTFPLLRGRGKDAAAANEMAAEAELESSRFQLHHTVSGSILNTGMTYWNYLAAQEQFNILKDAESRAGQLASDYQLLIDADQRPAADLDQLLANLADKTTSRISAEQRLFEAQHALGLAIGLQFEEIMNLPAPADVFPEAEQEALPGESEIQGFVELALEHRADLLAYRKREESAGIMLTAARKNRNPQLDFILKTGYLQLDEKGFGDTPGSDVLGAMQFQFPFMNNSLRGLLVQRENIYQQLYFQTLDLERNIRSNVVVAFGFLKRSVAEVENARKAVESYQKAVVNEKTKLDMGMSTVTDVVTLEDRLRNALLSEVSSQLNYANALLKLRYETGTLLAGDAEQGVVGQRELIEIPSLR